MQSIELSVVLAYFHHKVDEIRINLNHDFLVFNQILECIFGHHAELIMNKYAFKTIRKLQNIMKGSRISESKSYSPASKTDQQNPIRISQQISTFLERDREFLNRKKKMYEEGEERRIQEEDKARKIAQTRRFYHPSPIASPPKNQEIWDEEGKLNRNLIVPDNNPEFSQIESKPISPKLYKKELDAFLQRNVPSSPRPSNTSNNLSETKIKNCLSDETFDSFLQRQEQAAQKKNKDPPIPKQKSYISKSSSQLAAKALKKLANSSNNNSPTKSSPNDKKKTPKEKKKFNLNVAQAQGMIKDIELTSIKLEMEADQMRECTFTPSTDLSRAQSEKILKEREARQNSNIQKTPKRNQQDEVVNEPSLVKPKTVRKNPFPLVTSSHHH